MCAALMYPASFHCLVEEWTDCEKPSCTENTDRQTPNGMVCGHEQIPMHDMWENRKQKTDEDSRKFPWPRKEGIVWIGGWTQERRNLNMVQALIRICQSQARFEADEQMSAGKEGHERACTKCSRESLF